MNIHLFCVIDMVIDASKVWTEWDGYEYFCSKYWQSNSWYDVRTMCHEEHAELISFRNSDEKKFISEWVCQS